MTVNQSKRRPLSRYLKDFKHSQTHCAHCHKLLDRITLVRRDEIVNKTAIAQLDTLMDEATWQVVKNEWIALCRFCSDLHCNEHNDWFDIIGFKQYLFEQTDMSHGTIREYVVRLRRLAAHLADENVPKTLLDDSHLDEALEKWLPDASPNNYRIALRKYAQYLRRKHAGPESAAPEKSTSDIY